MPRYNLIEYSDNYSKTSRSVGRYYRDEPILDANGAITNFPAANNNSASFKFKQKITGKTANGGTKDVEIIVPLKCLSNFWRTLETPLINFEINLIFIWPSNCLLPNGAKATIFAIIDTRPYAAVVTLATQDKAKLLQKLKSGFKRTINWHKY